MNMAVAIFGIIALGSVAMSFAFCLFFFRVCLQELNRSRSLSADTTGREAGLFETVADRALSDVGRLFLMDARKPLVNNSHPDAESEPEPANPASALPQRPH